MAEYEIDPKTGERRAKLTKQPEQPSAALSASHEIFCRTYIVTGDSFAAWEYAFGAKGSKQEIKALLGLPNVINRIDYLRAEHLELMQQSAEVNVDLLVRKLELARKLAMKNDEAAAATAAIMAQAKLHGLLVDKRETSFKRIEDMTEAEINKILGEEFNDDMRKGNGLAIEHRNDDNETIN